MKITCRKCNSQFELASNEVPVTGGFMSCAQCGGRVVIPPPSRKGSGDVAAAPKAGAPSAAAEEQDAIPLVSSDDLMELDEVDADMIMEVSSDDSGPQATAEPTAPFDEAVPLPDSTLDDAPDSSSAEAAGPPATAHEEPAPIPLDEYAGEPVGPAAPIVAPPPPEDIPIDAAPGDGLPPVPTFAPPAADEEQPLEVPVAEDLPPTPIAMPAPPSVEQPIELAVDNDPPSPEPVFPPPAPPVEHPIELTVDDDLPPAAPVITPPAPPVEQPIDLAFEDDLPPAAPAITPPAPVEEYPIDLTVEDDLPPAAPVITPPAPAEEGPLDLAIDDGLPSAPMVTPPSPSLQGGGVQGEANDLPTPATDAAAPALAGGPSDLTVDLDNVPQSPAAAPAQQPTDGGLNDLPEPVPATTADDPFAAGAGFPTSGTLDDGAGGPVPSVAGLDELDDSAPLGSSAGPPSEPTAGVADSPDLDGNAIAPSLMDEMGAMGDDSTAQGDVQSFSMDAGPPLMDLDDGSADGAPIAGAEQPSADPFASLGTDTAQPDALPQPPEDAPKRRARPLRRAAIGVGLALATAGVISVLPMLGVSIPGLEMLLGLTDDVHVVDGVKRSPQAAQADANGAPPQAQPPAAASKTPPQADEPAKPQAEVTLTPRTVDALPYPQLKPAAEALGKTAPTDDAEQTALLQWARFRLAHVFGDEAAASALIKAAPPRPEARKLSPLFAAAGLGALLLSGKAGPARRSADKLRGKANKDARIAYVLGLVYAKRGPPARALKMLDKALQLDSTLTDARLARAEITLAREADTEVVRALLEVAKEGDPDRVAHVAQMLFKAGQLDALPELVGSLSDETALEAIAPMRRDAHLKLLVRARVRAGDLQSAAKIAGLRAELDPQSVRAALEHARLTAACGDDPSQLISAAIERATETADKAELLAEQVRQALGRKDVDAAQQAVKASAALPPRTASRWIRLSEGRIAEHTGNEAMAKRKYSGALQGRGEFVQARLALLLLSPGTTGQQLVKLTQLARRSNRPEVDRQLAMTMSEQGNHAGAARLLDGVLWRDPTVVDPVDLLLQWIDEVDRAGEALRAEALTEGINASLRDDDRPVLKLIEMAKRGGRVDGVVKWYKTLLDRHPNHTAHTVALADTLMDHGKHVQAQGLLDALLKLDPEQRTAELLYQLGRSWQLRDAVKARGYLESSNNIEPRAKTYLLIGVIEEGRGKTDEALTAYRQALKIDPQNADARLRTVRALMHKGFAREAVAGLRTLLASKPRHAEAAELLGDAERDQGNPREAVGAYRMAMDATEPSARVLMKIARLQLQELDMIGPAVKTLRQAAKVDPHHAEARYYLGFALKDLGRRDESRNALQEYLRLSPSGEFASEVRQELDAMRGL